MPSKIQTTQLPTKINKTPHSPLKSILNQSTTQISNHITKSSNPQPPNQSFITPQTIHDIMTITQLAKKCVDSNAEIIKKLVDYTSQTGNETGTIFYSSEDDKCVAKDFCIGTSCSVRLKNEDNDSEDNDRVGDIHVHPSSKLIPSYGDVLCTMTKEIPFSCIANVKNEILCFVPKTDDPSLFIRDAKTMIEKHEKDVKITNATKYTDEINGVSTAREFDLMIIEHSFANDIKRLKTSAEHFDFKKSTIDKSITRIYETELE